MEERTLPIITHTEFILAPIQYVFDLSRDVKTIERTTTQTKQKAIGGKVSGFIELGESVTWKSKHYGFLPQRLTSKIVYFESPFCFIDSMEKGIFKSFTHTHTFIEERGGTRMLDRFEYTSPFGPLGALADKLFLEAYMRSFIVRRAKLLKKIAENENDK